MVVYACKNQVVQFLDNPMAFKKELDAAGVKLASVGEMYRFFTDEARNRRDLFLEWIVIVLIALEIVLALFRH